LGKVWAAAGAAKSNKTVIASAAKQSSKRRWIATSLRSSR
jgi:hypothetical protein